MKKRLLTLAAGLIATAGVFAAGSLAQPDENQYWNSMNYLFYNDEGYYDAWEDVSDRFLISFGDSTTTWSVLGLEGLTDFTNEKIQEKWSTGAADRYVMEKTGTSLKITFDPTVSGWGSFGVDFTAARTADGVYFDGDSIVNNLADLFIEGYVVNTDRPTATIIKGEVKIPAGYTVKNGYDKAEIDGVKQFIIRASMVDVHGHEFNADLDQWAYINPSDFGDFVEFEIDYRKLMDAAPVGDADHPWGYNSAHPGDGWAENYYGLERPIATGQGADLVKIPIDFANIMGIRFYLEPGEGDGGQGADYLNYTVDDVATIEFRNLVIGDSEYAVTWTPEVAPVFTSINEEDSADEVVEYKIVGNTVYAKGNIVIYNDFGQVVAKGKDKVQVNASGSFNLVTPNGSAKIVK